MDVLETDGVAIAAGTTADVVRRLAEIGVVARRADGFVPADVVRVRLALALEDAGVSREDLADALASGRLSFGFVEQLMPEPMRLSPQTHGEVLATLGLPTELAERLRAMLGARVSLDDPVREDDAELVGMVARALELGAPPERLLSTVRTFVENAHRMASVQRQFVDDVLLAPAIAEHGSAIAALEATSAVRLEYRALARRLIALLLERVVDDAVFQNLVQLTEAALVAGGVPLVAPPEAIAFVDVSNYTRISEEAGDAEAARQASRLAEITQSRAEQHRGRLVKALGDGAMLHFPSPADAVRATLALVESAAERGLWALHAGVNAGAMVRRDGDYFGTTVNIASRVADRARPGETLVTASVTEAWDGGTDIRFVPVGDVELKNMPRPVSLYRAERSGHPAD